MVPKVKVENGINKLPGRLIIIVGIQEKNIINVPVARDNRIVFRIFYFFGNLTSQK